MFLFVIPPNGVARSKDVVERYERIARALQPSVAVEFAVPENGARPAASPRVHGYACDAELHTIVDRAAAAMIPAEFVNRAPSLASTSSRLVVDLSRCDTLGSTALRAGDFFLCDSERERDAWLPTLGVHRRLGAGTRTAARLRRLIDVVSASRLDPTLDVGEREHAIDPLRLYWTSTLRQPREWAWSPPSAARKALHVLRHEGIRALMRKVARRWPAGKALASPAARAAASESTAARLSEATSVASLQSLLVENAIVGSETRFMDLEIDVTNKCNIRCRMCYFSFDGTFHARPEYLDPATFARIADGILPHAKSVMLSLGSEPLLSPHFARILELAARHRVPELGFYTNGLLLNDRIIDAIVEHGVTVVAISVDGATKRTFEAIRRGADFDLLLRNVRALTRRRAARPAFLPRIRFGVVMMRQNIEELPDLVTLAWRLGVQELNFFHAVIYEGLDMDGQSLVKHKALSNEFLARARARAHELGLTIVHNPSPFELDPVSHGQRPPRAASSPYCRFPFFHVSIDSQGRVMPCPFAHGEAPFGVVTPETSFEAIWLGPAFTDLRRRILTNDPPAMCQRCSYLASAYPDLGELFESRPH